MPGVMRWVQSMGVAQGNRSIVVDAEVTGRNREGTPPVYPQKKENIRLVGY